MTCGSMPCSRRSGLALTIMKVQLSTLLLVSDLIGSCMYLVLSLSVALCELPEGAEIPLETSQLGCGSRAGLSVTAASTLPQTGPQGQQKITDQELHPLERKS